MSLPCPPFWLQPDPVPCVNPSEEYQSVYSVRRPGVTIAAVQMLPLDIHVTSPCWYFIIVHNSMFVTVGYLGTLKYRGTVYNLDQKGRRKGMSLDLFYSLTLSVQRRVRLPCQLTKP